MKKYKKMNIEEMHMELQELKTMMHKLSNIFHRESKVCAKGFEDLGQFHIQFLKLHGIHTSIDKCNKKITKLKNTCRTKYHSNAYGNCIEEVYYRYKNGETI